MLEYCELSHTRSLHGVPILHQQVRGIFSDGPGDGGFWSYNQAMPMEALAYLTQFDPANSE